MCVVSSGTYLDSGALVRVLAVEEGGDDVSQGSGDVIFQGLRRPAPPHRLHVLDEAVLKQLPHVVGSVDLFDFSLSVDVAVGQKVDVGVFHL